MNIYDVYKNPVGKIYADATGLDIMSTIVTAVEAGSKTDVPHYFYFEAVEAGSSFQIKDKPSDHTYEYSSDEKNWTNLDTTTITLANVGDRAYIRQTSDTGYFNNQANDRYTFTTTGNLKVGGCISTLAYNEIGHTSPTRNYAFAFLFRDCNITDASNLKVDFMEMTESCCYAMFAGCTNLQTAPELPATTLVDSCYQSMFSNCTSLTTAPELPATELTQGCYLYMFYNCTSLTAAPELPATELVNGCYSFMFKGCTSLNSITIHATYLPAFPNLATNTWVDGVSQTGTFTCPAGINIPTGNSGIPSGWTRVDL